MDDRQESDAASKTPGKLAFALVLTGGIVGPGALNYAFSVLLGNQALGRLVWIVGYTATIVVLWFYWLRPLDLRGPESGREHERGASEDTDEKTEA